MRLVVSNSFSSKLRLLLAAPTSGTSIHCTTNTRFGAAPTVATRTSEPAARLSAVLRSSQKQATMLEGAPPDGSATFIQAGLPAAASAPLPFELTCAVVTGREGPKLVPKKLSTKGSATA